MSGLHVVEFSHEYGEGPSGPARSYWRVKRGTADVGGLCLHHRDDMNAALEAQTIGHLLDHAFQAGQQDKARETRRVLGLQ